MLVLGPTETFQLVDRSAELPVMRALSTLDEIVALAAPALAAVADAYTMAAEAQRFGLMNRLEDVLRDCADSGAPGLREAAPVYRLLPFSRSAVLSFSKIRQVLGEEDLFLHQTYAVAHGEDIPLLLIDTDRARQDLARLNDAGIDLGVRWIGPGAAGG